MGWTAWLQMRVSTCEAQADTLELLSLAQEKTAFKPSGSQSIGPAPALDRLGHDLKPEPLHQHPRHHAAHYALANPSRSLSPRPSRLALLGAAAIVALLAAP